MIHLTKQELENFVPVANWVLIKPNRGETEYVLSGGIKIQIDVSYNQEQHAPVTGSVVAPPKSLLVASKGVPGMWWDVDMELRKVDVVAYSYLAAMGALEPHEGRIIMCENEPYFMIPYEECFVAKRIIPKVISINMDDIPLSELSVKELLEQYEKFGDSFMQEKGIKYQEHPESISIIPINGYCLVEPVSEVAHLKIGNMDLEQVELAKKNSAVFGKVAYISRGLIRSYVDKDGNPDTDEVRIGDYIAFDKACDILCEYDIHASLEGKKQFYRIQRRYIRAVVSKSIIDVNN